MAAPPEENGLPHPTQIELMAHILPLDENGLSGGPESAEDFVAIAGLDGIGVARVAHRRRAQVRIND